MNRATAGLGLSGVLSSSISSVIISLAVYFMMQTTTTTVPPRTDNTQNIPRSLQLQTAAEDEQELEQELESEDIQIPKRTSTSPIAPTVPTVPTTNSAPTVSTVPTTNSAPEVFLYLKGGYENGYTKSQAYNVCPSGSVLANESQLEEAQRNGADWCAYGWTTGRAGYPQQTSGIKGCSWDVGGARTYFSDDSQSTKRGVTCYGPKPDKNTDERIHPFNKSLWSRFD